MKQIPLSRAAVFNLRVLIGCAFCSIGLLRASAQIGGGGTTNYVPLWTGSSTLGNSNIYQNGTRVGIGTTGPLAGLDVHDASDTFTIRGSNTHAGGAGLFGTSGSTANGTGVFGLSTNNSGKGVFGSNSSLQGTGVLGVAGASGIAIQGVAVSESITSVDLTQRPVAVWGSTNQAGGVGVAGLVDSGTAVLGINSSSTAPAGLFESTNVSGTTYGVEGTCVSPFGAGVYGNNTSAGGFGVWGASTGGYGVYGTASNGYGVYATSSTGVGILGTCAPTGSNTCFNGVAGQNLSTSGGVNGLWGLTMSPQGNAVYLVNSSGGGNLIYGTQSNGGNATFYVQGNGSGYFAGNLTVGGTLTKGGGSFKIDDPLDPANKYLSHSFVESPDMMNVYNGNITTDAKGSAIVELPEYFEALNRDFRYQLTVIGQFAQAIVAKEISHNHFTIKTSQPRVKVSWQVTGIRQDAWANAHRIATEEDKPSEKRGTYLYPELYGASADKNTDAMAQE